MPVVGANARRFTALAAILLLCACSKPSGAKPASLETMLARQRAGLCERDISQRGADLARAAFPNTDSDWAIKRNEFIRHKRWEIFDENRDGRLSSDEFLNAEWAGFLAQLPAGSCVVTKQAFMERFLGDPADKTSGWFAPYQPTVYEGLFKSFDTDGKGYITKQDIAYWVRGAFGHADRDRKGYLVPSDFY